VAGRHCRVVTCVRRPAPSISQAEASDDITERDGLVLLRQVTGIGDHRYVSLGQELAGGRV
jgi:hypothetical protein